MNEHLRRLHAIATDHLPLFSRRQARPTACSRDDRLPGRRRVRQWDPAISACHALPEHLAHGASKVQIQLVGVLALLALFTQNHIFWIAALLIALVEFPNFSAPLASMIQSLESCESMKRTRERALSDAAPGRDRPSAVLHHGTRTDRRPVQRDDRLPHRRRVRRGTPLPPPPRAARAHGARDKQGSAADRGRAGPARALHPQPHLLDRGPPDRPRPVPQLLRPAGLDGPVPREAGRPRAAAGGGGVERRRGGRAPAGGAHEQQCPRGRRRSRRPSPRRPFPRKWPDPCSSSCSAPR